MTPLRSTLLAFALTPLLAQGAGAKRPAPGTFPEADAAAYSKNYAEAVAAGKWDEAVKALVLKLRAEELKKDEGEGDYLRALTGAADTAPEKMRAPLRALLAHEFKAYHDRHRYELAGRTAGASGDKLEGWDAARLLKETDARFTAALADETALRAIPVSAYSKITDKGAENPAGDARRPTLFDFLAYDALEYFTRDERFTGRPDETPNFAADSPLTGDTGDFLSWHGRPARETDADHGRDARATDDAARAVQLLQRLLRAHRSEPLARAEADLARLRWARRATSGDTATRRIREQLTKLAEAPASGPVATDAFAELAELALASGDAKGARAFADKGRAANPGTPGAARCENMIRDIETPEASLKTERVWNAPWPRITVVHKNLSKLHFRVVRSEWKDFLGVDRGRPEWLNDKEKADVLAGAPVKTWSVDLPASPDYKLNTDRLPVPEDLAPGFYFLVASTDENFSGKTSPLLYTDFWVSTLAVVAGGVEGGKITGRVCDAATGEPIAGATVSGWSLQNRRDRTRSGDATTDASGAFALSVPANRGVLILASTADGRELGSMQEFSAQPERPPVKPHNRIRFFTDRGIYRPGQSVKFKGVVLRAAPETLEHRVISGRTLTVMLDDTNGKEIARVKVTTNDYGAFDGAFEIPRDRLPGTYALHTTGNENGRDYFQVEEYKRPTFEVKMGEAAVGRALARAANDDDSPARASARPTVVTGTATTYTDAPVDGAKVTWRITRAEMWPMWCWWRPSAPPEQIAQGESLTDAGGKFSVTFDTPEIKTGRRGESPVYTYNITADVTDAAGETRAGSRLVAVGAVDRTAEIAPVGSAGEAAVALLNLDREPVSDATGKLVFRRLKAPMYVHRKPLESDMDFRSQRHIARLGKHAHGGALEEIGDEDGEDDSGVKRERLDLSNPRNWEAGEIAAEVPFTTDDKGYAKVAATGLAPGNYRIFLESKDSAGRAVTARAESRVLPESGDKLPLKEPFVLTADLSHDYQPGDTFTTRWGTGYETGRAFVEIFRRNKPAEKFWTEAGKTLADIRVPVTEADRGGLVVSVSQIRENRLYSEQSAVKVPWTNKELSLSWEHFTDKLKPGAPETWTALVRGPDGKPAPASLVATLYDASLDAYRPLDWQENFGLWPEFSRYDNTGFLNLEKGFRWMRGQWPNDRLPVTGESRAWAPELVPQYYGNMMFARATKGAVRMEMAPAAAMMSADSLMAGARTLDSSFSTGAPAPAAPSLDAVNPRRNLQETAFFLPQVETGPDGVAKFSFTVPESLTRWRFLAFAHDKQLRTGTLEASAVTALDLMVKPNPPRFLREGDTIELPVKLLNRTDKPLSGSARLSFDEVATKRPMDAALGNTETDKKFTIPAKGSIALTWRVLIPDGCGPLAYTVKAAAASGDSDGETGVLPVLSRRIQVTESKAAALTGPGEVRVRLDNLAGSGASDTLRSTGLRVDTVSRPAWYAVMALPYLMEYPHECAEQLFHRYYANALAHHIAASDPKLRATFDAWKGTDALDSPLEKDADLKGLLLEETPWVREAASESHQRRRVGLLFDNDRLTAESTKALRKLDERRGPDGGWSWFPGGESSPWVSRTVVLGIGRLASMGVQTDAQVALNALPVLDKSIRLRFEDLKKHAGLKDFGCDSDIAHTLHARGYFLTEAPIPGEAKEAYDFFVERAKTGWSTLDRASQARLALALPKFGDAETPALIVKSLRERSVSDGDKGMRWNDAPALGWWRPWVAPVETQALMVEVFETVAKDPAAADACRLALLANKRTNAWETTTATADACYAMLMRGSDWLSGDAGCAVTVGGKALTPDKVEAGTGAASVSVPTAQITPASADILVKKSEPGPAWVSAHWSYLEDAGKVKDANQSALSVKKTLWKKVLTKAGPQLVPVSGNRVAVGDELVIRLEVTNDRDLEFVHIKDGRPACVEPGITLSGYKYAGGLGYYEAVRDTATHRFVEHMPKGTHVFEFSARADRRGVCGSGLSEVRCMYAPEFAAHGGAPAVTVE